MRLVVWTGGRGKRHVMSQVPINRGQVLEPIKACRSESQAPDLGGGYLVST